MREPPVTSLGPPLVTSCSQLSVCLSPHQVHSFAKMLHDVELVEHDLFVGDRQMLARGGDVRRPHVHGHRFHMRQLLGRVLAPERAQAFFLPLVDHVQYPSFTQCVHHCDVLVSPSDRRLVHSHSRRQRGPSPTFPPSCYRPRTIPDHFFPPQSHPLTHCRYVPRRLHPSVPQPLAHAR